MAVPLVRHQFDRSDAILGHKLFPTSAMFVIPSGSRISREDKCQHGVSHIGWGMRTYPDNNKVFPLRSVAELSADFEGNSRLPFGCCTTLRTYTGGKPLFTHWVCGEYMVGSETKYPAWTRWVHFDHFCNSPPICPVKYPPGTC